MGSRLDRVTNWEHRARVYGYRVYDVADSCGVQTRTLERYFFGHFGMSVREWMTRLRQADAAASLRDLKLVKEVATLLRYKRASSLWRSYKKFYHVPPSKSP
jgi:transcriptional regulator GlxA family with amidase domain